MRPYLTDLLERMCTREPLGPGFSSEQSISWGATREAENLVDMSIVDELVAAVRVERSRHRRRASYFIVGKIGASTAEESCATRLLDFLQFETDKYCLARILEGIGETPKSIVFDYSTIEPWLRDTRWLVRHSAIQAFKNSQGHVAEDCVSRHLAQTTDARDQTYCHAVLNQIGTPRAIPLIEPGCQSRKRDVRLSAQLAILEIVRRSGCDFP